MPLALVFGNSHTGPYVRGHQLARANGHIACDVHGMAFNGDRYEPYILHTDRGVAFNPTVAEDILATIDRLKPDCLITACLGSDHWGYGMVPDARPFDFVVPALPQYPMSPGTELIPYDLMLRRFHIDMDWQFGIVRTLRTSCKLPLLHIEAPPPVEDAEMMLKGVLPHMKQQIEQLGVPTVSHRYKMWWIWTLATKGFCVEFDAHFIEGPAETRDTNGFLNPRYFGDGLHGSDEYGAVMAGETVKVMRSLGISGA